jgi:hypothetical protein
MCLGKVNNARPIESENYEKSGNACPCKILVKSLQSAAFLCVASTALAQDSNAPLPDQSHIPLTVPDNIPWEGDAARGEQQYKIFGDPAKPGWYPFF